MTSKLDNRPPSESSEFLDDVIRDLRSVATAGYRENIRAIVFRDIDTHSYGFSVSDGLLDKGVYIHSIKPDGPANRAGIQPYDKILQINNTRFNLILNKRNNTLKKDAMGTIHQALLI